MKNSIPMIILHQPPPAWGLPSVSPFCVKVETYLRMAKIEYKNAPPNVLKEAPNGRVPYVNLDGEIIGDSTLILRAIKSRFGDSLDHHLNDEQRAQALVLQRMVENHLYFAAAFLRWSDKESWPYVRAYFKSVLPSLVGDLILRMIRKDFLKIIRSQGMGEHSREDVISFAKADLTALSILLGDKKFFLGEQPSSIDATLYGFLVQQLWIPWESPIKQHGLSLPNLESFCHRMKLKYWS